MSTPGCAGADNLRITLGPLPEMLASGNVRLKMHAIGSVALVGGSLDT